jgi:PIN domain nuclease of toxin-antitoxin system
MLNLDTHIVVYAMTGELKPAELEILRSDQWGVSAIVLWELAKLAQLGRVEIEMDSPEVRRFLSALHIWPITLDVARTSTNLDFASDPADEIIAATSVVFRAPLVTRDRRLRRSKVVPLALV